MTWERDGKRFYAKDGDWEYMVRETGLGWTQFEKHVTRPSWAILGTADTPEGAMALG